VTRLTDAFNGMLDRLETERRESGYRALVAETAERRRLAAELHDEVGQRLTALLLRLERMRRLPRAEAAAEFDATLQAMKETLDVVRSLARRLRPEVLDELGLVPALRNLCDRIEKSTDVVVRRSFSAELPRLSPDAELVVYRVAQEALTNAIRHAHSPTARVALSAAGGGVELAVSDEGVGIAERAREDSSGGIRGMRERALLIGARLEIVHGPEGGTTIRLLLPPTD
jgi:two-component system sensor histidine kinase UhpB